jgi:hypothetical protein
MIVNCNTSTTLTCFDKEIILLSSVIKKLVDENNLKVIGFKYIQSISLTGKEVQFLEELHAKIINELKKE